MLQKVHGTKKYAISIYRFTQYTNLPFRRRFFVWNKLMHTPQINLPTMNMTTNTHIVRVVFTPPLLYPIENWTRISKEWQMLTTTEMRCLRKPAGKMRMDKITNEEIRRRVNMQPAERTANKNKIGWWPHRTNSSPG